MLLSSQVDTQNILCKNEAELRGVYCFGTPMQIYTGLDAVWQCIGGKGKETPSMDRQSVACTQAGTPHIHFYRYSPQPPDQRGSALPGIT